MAVTTSDVLVVDGTKRPSKLNDETKKTNNVGGILNLIPHDDPFLERELLEAGFAHDLIKQARYIKEAQKYARQVELNEMAKKDEGSIRKLCLDFCSMLWIRDKVSATGARRH